MSLSNTHSVGHSRRLARLFAADGRSLVIGFDHAVSRGSAGGTLGSIPALARECWAGGADALQLGLQSLRAVDTDVASAPGVGLVVRIDRSDVTDDAQQTVPVAVQWASPHQVAQVAGDVAVVFYVHDLRDPSVGAAHARMVGAVAEECADLGLPLMVEVMIKHELGGADAVIGAAMIDATRIAFELGADLVKVDMPQSPALMRDLVDAVPVSLLLRGGPPKATLAETCRALEASLDAGVAGAVFGRTVWQSRDPRQTTRELAAVVHGNVRTRAQPRSRTER